jgi:sugar phosphate permease
VEKQNSSFRWVVFASVLFTYLIMASQRTAPGLITNQLMSDFHITAATIGLLTSIQFFVYTSLQIPMGMLADRFGPNFFLLFGSILTGLGTIFYSLGTHEYVLFLARILIGIGDATIWVNLVLILSQWFNQKEFVRLIGFAGMTGSLGFLLATTPFSLLIDLLGWRSAFLIAGILLCLCGILLFIVLINKPKKLFLNETKSIKIAIQHEKTIVLIRRIFSSRQAWALFFCHFGIVGAYMGFISSWAVPYGMDMYGMSRLEASQLALIGLIGALIGAPLTGWVSSKLETMKLTYVSVHIITLLSWTFFLFFHGNPPFYILFVLFFIIGFGASALTFAVVRQTFPSKESGIVSGFANTGGLLSAVLLPSIFGMILDFFLSTTGNVGEGYYYGFITPVIFSMIGLIGVICVKERKSEQEMKPISFNHK